MTDPIADMLTRIRNAVGSRHPRVDLPASKLKVEIARILQDEGYIAGFKMVEESADGSAVRPASRPASRKVKTARQVVRLFLKYGPGGEKVISGIERVSRPGQRVYVARDEVPAVFGGLGVTILTTSRGVMSGRTAQKTGVGGEILCNVW